MSSGYMNITCRLLYQISVVAVTGALLSSCSKPQPVPSPPPGQLDKSPFTGVPCAAPCWYGLMIGRSNESDVATTLASLTFLDQKTIYTHRMQSMPSIDPSIWGQGIEITASCKYGQRPCLTIRVVENVLTEIVIVLNYDIELNAAMGYLGKPEYVGYRNLGAERVSCEIDLIWSERQLVLASGVFEGPDKVETNCGTVRDTGKSIPDLRISEVRYLSASAIERLRQTGTGAFFEFSGTAPTKQ